MAISVLIRFSDFCFPQLLFLHRTYPRPVFETLNEPQKIHFLPRKKLAAQLKTFFFCITKRNYTMLLVTKRPNYQIKIWFAPMFFSGFFCGFQRCGSAAFRIFRGGSRRLRRRNGAARKELGGKIKRRGEQTSASPDKKSRSPIWCFYCTKLTPIFKTNDVARSACVVT